MSCGFEDRVVADGPQARAHAAACAECAPVLERLRRARTLAKTHVPAPRPAARAEIWAALEGTRPDHTRPWALLAAAAACALAAILWPRPELPQPEELHLETGTLHLSNRTAIVLTP